MNVNIVSDAILLKAHPRQTVADAAVRLGSYALNEVSGIRISTISVRTGLSMQTDYMYFDIEVYFILFHAYL